MAFGFALASMAAGLVTVLFVNTPTDVLAEPVSRLPRTADETFELALLTATHAAVFGIVFTLIVATIGEMFSIRGLVFYLIGGVIIALLGFAAQYASEVPGEPTIFNNYALKAFITTGFFAGFVYWLAAGQFAGRADERGARTATAGSFTGVASDDETGGRRHETNVVIRKPAPSAKPRPPHHTLLNKLSFKKRTDRPGSNESDPAVEAGGNHNESR
jgi:hypothetical protein